MIDQFQARFQFVDSEGRLTIEANRFLRAWFSRIGGYTGLSNDDLALLASVSPEQANIVQMQQRIDDLESQLQAFTSQAAQVAEIKKCVEIVDLKYSYTPIATDWEHPGKIGAWTANTGRFTTGQFLGLLTASASVAVAGEVDVVNNGNTTKVVFSGTNTDTGANAITRIQLGAAQFTMDLYGAGHVNAGQVHLRNSTAAIMQIGTAGGTAIEIEPGNDMIFPQALRVLGAAKVASLESVGGFGCNTKTPQAAFALGAAAVTALDAIVLANNIRTALINNGIGS